MPPRPEFLEPLAPHPLSLAAAEPSLSIRIPPLKVWTCCTCHGVFPMDVYHCDCPPPDPFSDDESEGAGSLSEEEEEDDEEFNPWYCRWCDDFCSSGKGACRRCLEGR